jgi:hypothetical protein
MTRFLGSNWLLLLLIAGYLFYRAFRHRRGEGGHMGGCCGSGHMRHEHSQDDDRVADGHASHVDTEPSDGADQPHPPFADHDSGSREL